MNLRSYWGKNNIMATVYGSIPLLFDHFNSLNSSVWNTHGSTYGTVSVSSSQLSIVNTSANASNYIGIHSIQTFSVGTTIVVRSRDSGGRHCSLIGFGTSVFFPFPHATGGSYGCTWYSRGDVGTSTMSWRSENNVSGVYDSATEDLRQYQIFKMIRVSSSVVEFYRNDILEYTATGLVLANNYHVYFSNDGFSNPNSSLIDYISVI
jgi:hypothetical protein